jgi:hypothetical protein
MTRMIQFLGRKVNGISDAFDLLYSIDFLKPLDHD